jgi:hypothetical protein
MIRRRTCADSLASATSGRLRFDPFVGVFDEQLAECPLESGCQ